MIRSAYKMNVIFYTPLWNIYLNKEVPLRWNIVSLWGTCWQHLWWVLEFPNGLCCVSTGRPCGFPAKQRQFGRRRAFNGPRDFRSKKQPSRERKNEKKRERERTEDKVGPKLSFVALSFRPGGRKKGVQNERALQPSSALFFQALPRTTPVRFTI